MVEQVQNIALALEKTRHALQMDKASWADLLGIGEKDYEEARTGTAPVSIASLDSVARYLNLSLESFNQNDIDIPALVARFHGKYNFLRDRYSSGALSRRWSSINILDYLELYFGYDLRALALKRLQVSEAVFSDPNAMISMRFPTDLYDFMHEHGVRDSHFFSLGANSVMTYMNSPLGLEIRKARDVTETFELFCANIGVHLERNYHYWLERLDETSCVIAARPTTELQDSIGAIQPGSPQLCLTKVGVVSALPAYLGLPFADAEEITCIHRGDDACRIEANFEHAVTSASRPYNRKNIS